MADDEVSGRKARRVARGEKRGVIQEEGFSLSEVWNVDEDDVEDDIEPALRRLLKFGEGSVKEGDGGDSMLKEELMRDATTTAVGEVRCFCGEVRFRLDVFDMVEIKAGTLKAGQIMKKSNTIGIPCRNPFKWAAASIFFCCCCAAFVRIRSRQAPTVVEGCKKLISFFRLIVLMSSSGQKLNTSLLRKT